MLRSTVRLDFDADFVLSEVTEEYGTPFIVTRETVHQDDTITFIAEVAHERDAVVEDLETADAIVRVGKIGDSRLLVRKRSCGATPIIREHNGILYGLNYVFGTERIFEILTFNRDDIRAIVEEFGDIGTAELERIAPVPDRPANLSKRQYEVAMAAVEAGYYDWPREADAEEIADKLGITHPTFLEHLRKAERKLIRAALPAYGLDPFDELPGDSRFAPDDDSEVDMERRSSVLDPGTL